jgi:hypothetical protein
VSLQKIPKVKCEKGNNSELEEQYVFLILSGASVKRQKLPKARISAGQPRKKTLRVRYAEILSLRQAIVQVLSERKRPPADRRGSK